MTITTETVAVSAFNKMWINSTLINFLSGGSMFTRLQPYDGSYTLSTVVHSSIRNLSSVRASDQAFDQMLTNLETECRRQTNVLSAKLVTLAVSAPRPNLSVTATILFEDTPTHRIYDCFKLAQEDATFGGVFYAALSGISEKLGYTFIP
jgi:hypothetical protein